MAYQHFAIAQLGATSSFEAVCALQSRELQITSTVHYLIYLQSPQHSTPLAVRVNSVFQINPCVLDVSAAVLWVEDLLKLAA